MNAVMMSLAAYAHRSVPSYRLLLSVPVRLAGAHPAAKNQAAKTHGVKDHPLAPAVRIAGSPGFAPTHQPSKPEHGCSKRGHEWGKTAARACP